LNFIDIHCHILPGIDDGPLSMEESSRMLEMAKDDGIAHIFATPHIIAGVYNNGASDIIGSVERLRANASGKVDIHYGADVRITFDLIERIERREVLTLNGSRYMLIEFPEYSVPPHVDNLIFNLKHRGITPIITHPERHLRLMHDLSALSALRETGALCQITAMSITGGFGRSIRKVCFNMMEEELVDFVASDAHNAKGRPPILSKAYEEIKKEFGKDTSDRIFFSNPGMIVKAAPKEMGSKTGTGSC